MLTVTRSSALQSKAVGSHCTRCVACNGLSFFGRLGPAGSSGFNKYYSAARTQQLPTTPVAPEASTGTAVEQSADKEGRLEQGLIKGVHHVALICENLDRAMDFYQGVLGLEINPDRPHSKLPYRGAWLWIGPEMIHLMELPNPDPQTGRPEHGGRDRHFCIGIASIEPLVERLDIGGIIYTKSMSGRPAVFFRDPDMNTLEVVEMDQWR